MSRIVWYIFTRDLFYIFYLIFKNIHRAVTVPRWASGFSTTCWVGGGGGLSNYSVVM